jgi:hypothetical protein
VELESRRAEAEILLGEGLPLVGMLKSPEDLKKVPLPYILQLLEKIQGWFEMNLPDVSVKPPEYICAKERSFLSIQSFNLAVLVELAKEGLKQRMNGRQKK